MDKQRKRREAKGEPWDFNGDLTARPKAEPAVRLDSDGELVPDIDQHATLPKDAAPAADYRDWRHEDTRVVCFTTEPEKYPKDKPCRSLEEAQALCKVTYGRILATETVRNGDAERFFFRVFKLDRRVACNLTGL